MAKGRYKAMRPHRSSWNVQLKSLSWTASGSVEITLHPDLDRYMDGEDKEFLDKLAKKESLKLIFKTNNELHLNDFQLATPKGSSSASKKHACV
jgi:hypothetical protein